MRFLPAWLGKSATQGSDAVPVATHAQELTPEGLAAWLMEHTASEENNAPPFALMCVNLRRTDRCEALFNSEAAERVYGETCQRLATTLRAQDRFARIGPEELMLVLPGIGDEPLAQLAANRLLAAFERPLGSQRVRMRPCLGCAFFPHHGHQLVHLVNAADMACEQARAIESGLVIADRLRGEDMDVLLADLEAALRANELEVWFQPQVTLPDYTCASAEALLRWRNKRDERMVSPMLVSDMAENHGMMTALVTFVLNTTLRQLGELRRSGIELRAAVNASASLLRDTDLPQLVENALGTWGVPPDRLTVEVTEGTIMRDVERSLAVMHQLKDVGVRLSIDDFGTGYSSLAYLRRMPLNELKIDKLFVQNMANTRGDVQIVRSVIDLAHNFDLEAVAEGVEDGATLKMLQDLGCNVIQGYHYARPMPITQIRDWWPTRPTSIEPPT